MSEAVVHLNIEHGVARIVLNRPARRNALTRELIQQLTSAVEAIRDDAAVRAAVLSAEGPVFCAGMDLGEMQQRAASRDSTRQWHDDACAYRELLDAVFTLPFPTVAAVQGPAVAGGVGLVLACDIVLASENATFSLPEPKRGITASLIMPWLSYRVGAGAASYILLSGETINAVTALRFGICHEVVPAPSLASRTQELCRSILTGAPSALAKTKRQIVESARERLNQALDLAVKLSAESRETAEAREGLAAFLDKREPAWNRRDL